MCLKKGMSVKKVERIQVAVACLVMLVVTCAASAELSDIVGYLPDEGLTIHRLGGPDPGDMIGIFPDDGLPGDQGGSPNVSLTPEPATLVLLGAGGMALLRRRKRRSRA